VKNWFQSLPFKCNLQRYTLALGERHSPLSFASLRIAAGLCRLESS
jgi:hypothetical protein